MKIRCDARLIDNDAYSYLIAHTHTLCLCLSHIIDLSVAAFPFEGRSADPNLAVVGRWSPKGRAKQQIVHTNAAVVYQGRLSLAPMLILGLSQRYCQADQLVVHIPVQKTEG